MKPESYKKIGKCYFFLFYITKQARAPHREWKFIDLKNFEFNFAQICPVIILYTIMQQIWNIQKNR